MLSKEQDTVLTEHMTTDEMLTSCTILDVVQTDTAVSSGNVQAVRIQLIGS